MLNQDMWYQHKQNLDHFIPFKQEPEVEIVTVKKKHHFNYNNNKNYGHIHPLELKKILIITNTNYKILNQDQNPSLKINPF